MDASTQPTQSPHLTLTLTLLARAEGKEAAGTCSQAPPWIGIGIAWVVEVQSSKLSGKGTGSLHALLLAVRGGRLLSPRTNKGENVLPLLLLRRRLKKGGARDASSSSEAQAKANLLLLLLG